MVPLSARVVANLFMQLKRYLALARNGTSILPVFPTLFTIVDRASLVQTATRD